MKIEIQTSHQIQTKRIQNQNPRTKIDEVMYFYNNFDEFVLNLSRSTFIEPPAY